MTITGSSDNNKPLNIPAQPIEIDFNQQNQTGTCAQGIGSLPNSDFDFTSQELSFKSNPTTFYSVLKTLFKFSIAIPVLLFHCTIATIFSLVINVCPMPTNFRFMFQRISKVYAENLCNSVLCLWFNREFYIAIDDDLVQLLSNSVNGSNPPRFLSLGNHVSEIDWVFMSLIAQELNFFKYTYIIMKKEIASIPILGFLLKSFGHFFTIRQKNHSPNAVNEDVIMINNYAENLMGKYTESSGLFATATKRILKKVHNFLVKIKVFDPYTGANGLYYPEATTYAQCTYKNTLKHYEKAKQTPDEYPGLFKPKHVLLPRPLGTTALMAKLSETLDCICDFTMLSSPFKPSTYDYYSYKDIFLCKSEPFSFNMVIRRKDIPQDILDSVRKLDKSKHKFEYPLNLSQEEKDVKYNVSKFLNELFKEKDELIGDYANSETKGDFKDITEFQNYIKMYYGKKNIKMHCIPLKIHSPYKGIIFIAPFLFILLVLAKYFFNLNFISSKVLVGASEHSLLMH